MHFVVYAAPNYTENALKFIQATINLPDVAVGLVCQEPRHWMPPEISRKLADFRQVENVFDVNELEKAARSFSRNIHRMMGAVEPLQETIAEVREQMNLPGMRLETVLNFRDKARMKNLLRAAGIPCARHLLSANSAEIERFVQEVGFPLVVKPPLGVASQSTFKVDDWPSLKFALASMNPSPGREVLLEEFIVGEEHSFDTFTLSGEPVFHSLTHYSPTPLEVVREPWIQWQVLLPREVEDPKYDDIKKAAFQTLKTLGMGTGVSHLEWFRRRDGSIAISEVASRPPGAQIMTLISRANDFDAVSAWAKMLIFEKFEVPQRKYAVGAAYLRGQGNGGQVVALDGLEELDREIGHLVCDVRLPKIGQEKAKSYEGEGYVILRHPETSVVREALLKVVSKARVYLG